MTSMTFEETTPPDMDSTPELEDVEYPCRVCQREAGPYSGRGRKPTLCPDHKSASSRTGNKSSVKVTGATANLAAQATGVLVQLNGIMAIGLMAIGMNGTASAIAAANDTFETQANAALLTDPELCKLILRGGVKSAKVTLALAYVGMGTQVVPVAAMEMREMKEKRAARKAEME
jgi:hypothetical protein